MLWYGCKSSAHCSNLPFGVLFSSHSCFLVETSAEQLLVHLIYRNEIFSTDKLTKSFLPEYTLLPYYAMPYINKTHVNNLKKSKECWVCNANPCPRIEPGTLRLAAQHFHMYNNFVWNPPIIRAFSPGGVTLVLLNIVCKISKVYHFLMFNMDVMTLVMGP